MRTDAQAPTIRLADYRPPAWLADTVELTFRLDPAATRVRARIAFRPNPERADDGPLDLALDGRNLKLVSAAIDGAAVPQNALALDDEGLTVAAAHVPQDGFVWEAETEIAPEKNTALEGLYMSRGMYCTQCEAAGLPQDHLLPRPPGRDGDLPRPHRGRRAGDALERQPPRTAAPGRAEWDDPFPKPSYLFALVAGDLGRSRIASPPAPAATSSCRSGSAPATKAAAPTPWTR